MATATGIGRTPYRTASAAGRALLIAVGLLALWGCGSGSTPDSVAATLESSSGSREWAAALRTHYPREYRAMVDRLATVKREGGWPAVGREADSFLERFIFGKASAIARAPDGQLRDLATALTEVVRVLRDRDVTFCAQFFVNGARGGQPPAAAGPALSRANALMISVARAGETGGRAPRPPISQSDLAAWMARVRAIDPAVATLFDDGSIDRATPQQQCRAGQVIFQSVAELPPPIAGAVMAEIMRQGAREPR